MKPLRFFVAACAVAMLFFSCDAFAQTAARPGLAIQAGSMVAFDYPLTDESGNVIDTSKGKEPMHYVHGKGQIIPGLEKELAGMTGGTAKNLTVQPEDGYSQVNLM